jgi:hypothetical protein
MTRNLRIGAFIGIFVAAVSVAALIDASRFQRSLEVVTIAEARMAQSPLPPLVAPRTKAAKITPVRRENSTLADFIAPYRDCSVPAAANAIADDPRCEGLSLSENEPLETDPH